MLLKQITIVALLALSHTVHAQMAGSSRVYGSNDKDIVTPTHSTKTVSDPTAVQVLVDFVQGTALTGWSGMTGSGSIQYPGESSSFAANLSVLGGTRYRLDVVRESGTASTIYNGTQGVFVNPNGRSSSVSSDIATLGLIAFPRIISAGYPARSSIVTDRGTTIVNEVTMHRITLDDPSEDGQGNAWKTVDLYFDPVTGCLLESAAPVHLWTADAAIYMLETTFSNYQRVVTCSPETAHTEV